MKAFIFSKKIVPLNITLFAALIVGKWGNAQINPPGIGRANMASWVAIALSQNFGSKNKKNWNSVSYVGLGNMSKPNNDALFSRSSMLIINQEFKNRFKKNWEYSFALSYRQQYEYKDSFPYAKEDPAYKQEFRVYSRISYILLNTKRFRLTPTFRQEVRKFYTPDFGTPGEDWQLRSRIRLQWVTNLDKNKVHRIILTSEQLFSADRDSKNKNLSKFCYQDSRFALYYSYSPKNIPAAFNFGYMNNLIGYKRPYGVNHFAFDVTLVNPL